MANIGISQLLAAPTVTGAISTLPVAHRRLTSFFNLMPGSSAVDDVGGHITSWDIYDNVRDLPYGRAPGSGPSSRKPNPVGHVQARIARFHEKLMLLDEHIFRKRPIGGNVGEVDVSGQQYIAKQEKTIAQRFANGREFMVSRLFRGGWSYLVRGDDWIPVDLGTSGAVFNVDLQIPSGNKDQLDMLGGGAIIGTAWDNAAAPIIGDMLAINSAMTELTGLAVRHLWLNSVTMGYVLANTGLINPAGTSAQVFSSWTPSTYVGADGRPDTGFEIVLRGLPWLVFHVYDSGLNVESSNGTLTYTKFFPDGYVGMTPEPDDTWVKGFNGSEPVRENVMAASEERYGIQAWTEARTQPAGFELISLDNFLPALIIPKAMIWAHVYGF